MTTWQPGQLRTKLLLESPYPNVPALWVPKTRSARSSCQFVLMDQASEPVASSKVAGVSEGHGSRFCLLLWRALAEGTVGAVLVIVPDVLGEDLL
jgi:hypothetical protein